MLNYSWLVLVLLHSALPQTTDKYSDEDRPYKFGFNIQGYQHRQEEKDERGLIKGEYGFITADGYYRVTIYATDENGDFRIISMKNYYVGFPPEDPTTTPGPPSSNRAAIPREPLSNSVSARGPGASGRALGADDSTIKTPKSFTRPQGIAACSDCSIPTTTPRTSPQINPGDFRSGRRQGDSFGSKPLGQGQSPKTSPQGNIRTPGSQSGFPQKVNSQSPTGGQSPRFPQSGPTSRAGFSQGQPGASDKNAPRPAPLGPGNAIHGTNRQRPYPIDGTFGSRDSESPRGRTDFAQNNQLDDTPQRRPKIGEMREGLPPGVTLNDIKDLLYTFNYTVGFHGHHEDGYRNGDKQGDYFFDGRDGVERKVVYLANEFGFQPNITLTDLPENDVRRPNKETEKGYGLKGYEFKWFYRK